MHKYFKELESFLKVSEAGEITFEKKANGDVIISKKETKLIKKSK